MYRKLISIFLLLSSLLFAQAQVRDSLIRVGACATPGYADGVYVQGQYAYIADRAGFTSININNPATPLVVDFLNEPRCQATGVFISETLAFLNSSLTGPAFTIVNITNPDEMVKISAILVPVYGGDEPKGIYASDSLVYFADSDGGFLIINISDLLNPTILCTLETPGRVIDLYVRDTLAYLADKYSLLVVNVSDPNNPAIIGSLSVWGAYDVWVSGDYAFVTEEGFLGGQGKVNMINISDPTSPFLVDQISMSGSPYGLFVVNNRIYVAADDWWEPPRQKGEGRADIEGGIRVLHWKAPDSINLLVNLDTPGRCRDIFVVDSFIYIAAVDSFMIYKHVNTGISEGSEEIVSQYSLVAYPNPFSHMTEIRLQIAEYQKQEPRGKKQDVSLKIYDISGRLIRTFPVNQCNLSNSVKSVCWDGRDNNGRFLTKGVYFIRAEISENQYGLGEKVIYLGGAK